MLQPDTLSRRRFLGQLAAAAAAAAASGTASALHAEQQKPEPFRFAAFVKFIQQLNYRQMAETVAELGFDGIEATVRNGGCVLPERVEDDLPKLVEELKQVGLKIDVMTSNVNRADHPLTERVLKTAHSLGIRRYRMAYYKYDLRQPVLKQLEELRPVVSELAALNQQLNLTAVYQNHSGASNVGAAVWDLPMLLKGIPSSQVGVAFDIRHATVEGGQSWPASWNVVQEHLQAVYVKDFTWDGRRPKNVPLGQGQVDPQFFKLLSKSAPAVPVSLHVEYLHTAGLQPNIDALGTDLVTLKRLLQES